MGFVKEKCYCCWGWEIKVGKETIKAEQIPNLNPPENTVFPINVRITIGQKTTDCSGITIDMTQFPDYYEIKECTLIKRCAKPAPGNLFPVFIDHLKPSLTS